MKEETVPPVFTLQSQEIHATFKRGLMLLETAGQNQSVLGQALLSIHGALEDYFRFSLSKNSAVPAETQEVVWDRGKTQWRDLAYLAQKYNLISIEDKYLILKMNKKRQEIAHGKACDINEREVEHYAELIKSIIKVPFVGDETSPHVELIKSIIKAPLISDKTPPPMPSVVREAENLRSSVSTSPTHNPSYKSGYAIAVGFASVVLIVMIVGGLFTFMQSKNPGSSSSLLSVTTQPSPTPYPSATPRPTVEATAVLIPASVVPTTIAENILIASVVNGGNVRSETTVSATTVIGQVCPGDEVEILSQQQVAGSLWYRVHLSVLAVNCDPKRVAVGTEGWVSGTLLSNPINKATGTQP